MPASNAKARSPASVSTAIDLHLLRNAIDAARDGMTVSDFTRPDLPLVYVNPAFVRMTGYRPDDILGQNCRFLQGDDRDQPGVQEIRDAIAARRSCLVTLRNFRQDGSLFHNELSLSPLLTPDGIVTHYIGIQKDVSERVERELELLRLNEQLEKLASVDGLTGVLNRRVFDDVLQREWRRARRLGGRLTLFILDIDHFKELNDTHGHQVGDECLRRLGRELRSLFARATDFVARYGGEEFAVLCTDLDAFDALAQGKRLLQAIRRLPMPGAVDHVTISAGICSSPVDIDIDPALFVAAADAALYRAKRAGRDRMEFVGNSLT